MDFERRQLQRAYELQEMIQEAELTIKHSQDIIKQQKKILQQAKERLDKGNKYYFSWRRKKILQKLMR